MGGQEPVACARRAATSATARRCELDNPDPNLNICVFPSINRPLGAGSLIWGRQKCGSLVNGVDPRCIRPSLLLPPIIPHVKWFSCKKSARSFHGLQQTVPCPHQLPGSVLVFQRF